MAEPENVKKSDSIIDLAAAVKKSPSYTGTDSNLLQLSFEPQWINNVTRLNQQNLQIKLYDCLKKNYQTTGNTVSEDIYEKLNRIVSFLGGIRSTPQSNSEVHNNEVTFEANNTATGNYQSVFGKGNTSNENVDGQFIIGTYADSTTDYEEEKPIFVAGIGSSDTDRANAVVIKTDGTTRFYKDVIIPSLKLENLVANEITSNVIKITGVIPEAGSESYAVNKYYVDTAIANITAIIIRNKGEIEATFAEDPPDTPDKDKRYVQDVASRYIITNYNRNPKNFDGLILTITDAPTPNDRILYVYIEQPDETTPGIWINAGINSVDLSNYYIKEETYSKEEIDNMLEWQNW